MTNIETAISDFERQLRALCGFEENNDAILLQINLGGQNYIKSIGNLNSLTMNSAITLDGKQKNPFIEFMQREIELSSNKESTKELHHDTLKLIVSYTPNVAIQDITCTYLQELELYMRNERGLAINTIGRHMKTLKKYINIARKKELISKYPFLNYTIKMVQSDRETLTEKELQILEEYRASLSEQNETLNAFLFSCYTGLRYSDIRIFTKQKIYSINRKKWLILRTIKNNIEIRIPLSTIFEGKALALTRSINRPRGFLFHLSNNQQINRELKRIAKATGIKKEITFHNARHTCATLLLYRGVSITTVQKLLGHKSVKTTQIYSAVTDLTLEKELKKSNLKFKKR